MAPIELAGWAQRHHVSAEALSELSWLLGVGAGNPSVSGAEASEANVQSRVRLVAPHHGMRLFRNNVGVLKNEEGRPVRYGLGNDSPALNRRLKSSDLIGWRRLQIGDTVVAQFVALECKPEGWCYRGDEHEQAQQRWLGLVAADGGYAKFVTGPEQV